MNEKDLYTILKRDNNLREAIRRREQKQSTMPADLNERLMRRMKKPTPNPSPREGRIKNLRWLAAAAGLLIIVGVGVTLKPSGESREEVITCKTAVVQKETITDAPQSEAIVLETPKTVAIAESKTIRKSKKKAAPMQAASIEQNDSSLFPLPSSLKTVAEVPHTQLEPTPAVLTERDIPITRPENYHYTSEDLALIKEQANRAYIKRVQLELEIAKYNLEQTANNYKEQ